MANSEYSFNISLSVLNHLGRNLYRNFATILGEAISNSWDADAENVYINIDKSKNCFTIKDDGLGMNSDDFQGKFLKVGYSKRRDGKSSSKGGRPYIGRKGIGKLALLSCADRIHVASKILDSEIVGGIIDNKGLDGAITEDKESYSLLGFEENSPSKELETEKQGTIIFFENMKDGIFNTVEYLRKIIALYFRFSTLDPSFNIFVNGTKVTDEDLNDLVNSTQFLWDINSTKDDTYFEKVKTKSTKQSSLKLELEDKKDIITGFVVSVNKPSELTIRGTDDTVTVDLFVNGRLREKDILKHIRTRRVPESYIYGQINFNSLDDEEDRFTSSRESVKAEDPKFQNFISKIKTQVINKIMNEWDEFRTGKGEDGDSDNPRMSKKQRKAKELFRATAKEYTNDDNKGTEMHDKVNEWLNDLDEEAQFNFPSYSECFISENLTRKYIDEKNIPLSQPAQDIVNKWRTQEATNKTKGGINIDIRHKNEDKSYLDMGELSKLVEPSQNRGQSSSLCARAAEYKPIRDALMHTALISPDAKVKLTSVYNDIKARIRNLLK